MKASSLVLSVLCGLPSVSQTPGTVMANALPVKCGARSKTLTYKTSPVQ